MALNMDALLRIKADVQGENNIRKLGNSMQGVQGKVKNLQMAVGGLSGALKGLAAGLALGAFTAFVKQGIDAADAMGKASARTGVAAQELIGFQNAAALADISNEQLIKGLSKLNINMVAAAEGNDELSKRFEQLGVAFRKSDGTLRDTADVFKDLSDRFADMPNGAQKAAAAMSLFGKSGVDLITLLNGGSASLEEFNYKLSDDFAARSEYFNDSITKMGFRTQGFQMQLMDALLPALQSILDVFSDLFNTKQDWTALFEVIKVGLRAVATVIYATVKLVDVLIKNVAASIEAIQKAFTGDFQGAIDVIRNRIGNLVSQAGDDFRQIQKLWTDAPAPSGGVGRRGFDMRDLAAEREAAAAQSKAASEQERLLQRRQSLTRKTIDLQEQLRRSIEDVDMRISGVGASPIQQLMLERDEAIVANNRQIDNMTKSVVELAREVQAAGGELDIQPFRELINTLSERNVDLANKTYSDGLKEIGEAASEAAMKTAEFGTAVMQQSPILGGVKDGIAQYIESLGTLRENLADIASNSIKGLENAIVSLTTTGTFNFRQFALSVVEELTRMVTRMLILAPLLQLIQSLIPGGGIGGTLSRAGRNLTGVGALASANGNVFAANGVVPFAMGGVVNQPTLFKFANGGVGRLGLMGEAGPEAIIPLKRGRDGKLGVAGGGSTNVVVNVDASGSQVQGDNQRGEQLGRAISQAVQAELVKQKRPGGLLAA